MKNAPLQRKLRFLQSIRPDSLFHVLFDHLQEVGLFAKDVDGHFLAVNQVLVKRFGFQEERQMIGKTDDDLFPREMVKKYRADDQRVMRTRKPMLNIVELAVDHLGIPCWHRTNKMPVFARDGRVIGIMGTIEPYEVTRIGVTHQSLLHAFEWIRDHCNEAISVEALAKKSGFSIRQFERQFQQQLWMSPRELITKMRVNRACEKLRQRRGNLGELALECGFYDQSEFSRQFKKHTGTTPLQYRKRYG